MKRFTGREEAFECEACGAQVEPLVSGTYRDHCPACLTSKHVDVQPGDRASDCGGPLVPIGLLGHGATQKIAYRCERCGQRKRNRPAPDDAAERLIELASQPTPL